MCFGREEIFLKVRLRARLVGGDKGAGGNPRFPPAVLFISFRYRICFRQNKLQYRSIPNTLLNMLSTVLLFRYK